MLNTVKNSDSVEEIEEVEKVEEVENTLITDIDLHKTKEQQEKELKQYWVNQCDKLSLRDHKNYQVVWSRAGSYQVWPIGPRFTPSEVAIHPFLATKFVYKSEYDFPEESASVVLDSSDNTDEEADEEESVMFKSVNISSKSFSNKDDKKKRGRKPKEKSVKATDETGEVVDKPKKKRHRRTKKEMEEARARGES